MPLWTRYQTSPSGRTAAAVIEPGSVSRVVSAPVASSYAVQPVTAFDELQEQQRRPVGPPVGGLHRTLEVGRQVDEVAGPRVPRGRALLAGPLVRDRDPRVALDRREREPGQLAARVAQLRDGRPGPRVDRAQRRVQDVAVLHDLEHDDRLVARERLAVDGAGQAPPAGEADGLRVLVDLARDRAPLGRPDGVALLGGQAGDRAGPADREALGPAVRDPLEQRLGPGSLVERRDDVAARLGARRVVEPDDAAAVAGRPALEDPDGVLGHLAPHAGRAVPRVQLVAAALGRRHDEAVGGVGRPGREGEEGSPEPALPGRQVGHAADAIAGRSPPVHRPVRPPRRHPARGPH